MTRTEKLQILAAAEMMGTKAFHDGKKAAPAQDKAIMDYLQELTDKGTIPTDLSMTGKLVIPMLQAWGRGFHRANAASAMERVMAQA